MSANQPTSFRLPFALPEDVHPAVRLALRYTFSGLKDVNDAIVNLMPKVNSQAASITTINNTIPSLSSGGSSTPSTLGKVNDQTGNVTYILQQSDFGALVILNTASPFALSLNSSITVPFLCVLENFGTGLATLTPTLGLVNNLASWPLPGVQFALVFFDGFNWWVTEVFAQSFLSVPHEWLNSYNALTGVFTATQPRASDLVDSTVGSGPVVLDSGPTLVNPTFTGITRILGLQIFANNAAAIAGGLPVGGLYRSGSDPDHVLVVH